MDEGQETERRALIRLYTWILKSLSSDTAVRSRELKPPRGEGHQREGVRGPTAATEGVVDWPGV